MVTSSFVREMSSVQEVRYEKVKRYVWGGEGKITLASNIIPLESLEVKGTVKGKMLGIREG